jgi:superfamily II DNA or RNA helicase
MDGIIDNQKGINDGLIHLGMADIFKEYIKDSKDFKFHVGTGFFFLDGFGELYKNIDLNKLNYGSKEYEALWNTTAPILVVMGKQTNQTTKEALLNARNMIKYALNAHDEDYLTFLEKLIEEGLIKFKVFTDSRFHAKIYFFYNGEDSIEDIYVGSANLTSAGLTKNIELTAPVAADKFYRNTIKQWYKNLWDRSTDDFNVLEIIKSYKREDFIYYEPKKFFENLIKLMEKDYLFYNSDISDNTLLVKFQSFDFYQVMSTLNRYNGCILASSVGLGKSYVALEVMRHIENNDMEALLIGPSNLVKGKDSTWGEYLKQYNLEVETIGFGDLQQKSFDPSKYLKYDIVVIDEAHNLRNPSLRRKNLIEIIKNSPKAKYLLMTATPINIKISDLNSLIDLFYDINKHNWLDKELKTKYETFKTQVNKLERTNEYPEKLFNEVVELQNFVESQLIVKSTRNMIKKYFADDLKKLAGSNELPDPEVISVDYKYSKEYHNKFFDKLPNFLIELNFEYSKFHLDEKEGPKYSEDRNLIYMYKWLLYKRAESSIYSFYSSTKRLKETIQIYISYLENKILVRDLNKYVNKEREERLKIAGIIFDSFNTDAERQKTIINMKNDLYSLSKIIDELEDFKEGIVFKDDRKLVQLKEILSKNGDKKCLIFTEYYDTLEYILKNLKNDFSVDYVAGKTLKGQVMKPSQKETRIVRFKDDKFQHLISTDVLAEGFNIPEADIVINYDLPYNPVKIIQRVGRATRINYPKKIEIMNFNPDELIDQELNLVEKLDLRISNIISLIGIDYSIWADTEKMIKEREQVDSVNKCKILKELKKRIATENPEEIYKIKLREESKLDLLIKSSIDHYNLVQDDIPANKPLKPIYTTLVDKKPSFYGIYEFNKDFFEYGNPVEFIEEPPKFIRSYNKQEINEFCEIIKNKYMNIIGKIEDRSMENPKDKETITKLKNIKKEIPPLINTINKIFKSKFYTNYEIAEIIKKEIYPKINEDNFSWFAQGKVIDSWKKKLENILEKEGAHEISHVDEWLKKPDEYKTMIKAFIQYKEADQDV